MMTGPATTSAVSQSARGVHVFDTATQTANLWLKELAAELGGEHQAYQALRATLHALRDRITIGEATDLGAQLPMVIKGIYYDQWRPRGRPMTYRTREEFLDEIRKGMADQGASVDPADAARAVFHVLRHHVSDEEMREVLNMLPEQVRALSH